MPLPQLNTEAPLFSLPDQNGELVTLSQYKGKQTVVLYFYPKALTPGCNTQACGIRDSKQQLEDLNTVVFGISPDFPQRLQRFEEKKELNFTLLSDEDHTVAESYGVWGLKKFMGKEYMGIHRITFILGNNGKIVHIIEKVKTKTHHEDVLNWIQENGS